MSISIYFIDTDDLFLYLIRRKILLLMLNIMDKLEKLDAFVSELGLSQQELENWVISRIKLSHEPLIPTALPIVYKRLQEFYVLSGLDMTRKEDVWGWLLPSNIIMKKAKGADSEQDMMTWHGVKDYAESHILNGKIGHLPYSDQLLKTWLPEIVVKARSTAATLKENGITAEDESMNACWCAEEKMSNCAQTFMLYCCRTSLGYKTFDTDRILIQF